jgi:hypothetical protein
MNVSSGLPRKHGLRGISHVIRARTRSVTVDRVTETTGSLGETQTTTAEHTESMWLFEPRESVAQEIAGERINGGLGGLALADGTVDLQHNDRITHGGVEYEIDTIVGHPEDDKTDATDSPDTDFWLVSFVRRQ